VATIVEVVPIESVRPTYDVLDARQDAKTRGHHQAYIDKYVEEIRAYRGRDLVVAANMPDDQPNLIDGHHRLAAYKKLGITHVPVTTPTPALLTRYLAELKK
jgi:hypothetical protein